MFFATGDGLHFTMPGWGQGGYGGTPRGPLPSWGQEGARNPLSVLLWPVCGVFDRRGRSERNIIGLPLRRNDGEVRRRAHPQLAAGRYTRSKQCSDAGLDLYAPERGVGVIERDAHFPGFMAAPNDLTIGGAPVFRQHHLHLASQRHVGTDHRHAA